MKDENEKRSSSEKQKVTSEKRKHYLKNENIF
jgi:hypothetical protein